MRQDEGLSSYLDGLGPNCKGCLLQLILLRCGGLTEWSGKLSDGGYRCAEVSQEDAKLLAEAERRITTAGLLPNVELKLGGIAIHWRGLPFEEVERVQRLAVKAWTPLAESAALKLLQFEAGLELRVARPDKGDAVRSVLADLEQQAPIAYLGDDLTDEDAFRVLNEHGLSILVREEYRQTVAGAWIKPPQQLIEFFERGLASLSNH